MPAECIMTATGFTPLLMNLESMTSKHNAGEGSKDCVAWPCITLYMQIKSPQILLQNRKIAAAAGGLSHMGRGAAPLQTSPQVFEHFLAPGNPAREWERMLVLHIPDADEETLSTKGEKYSGSGSRRIALGKKAFQGLFGSTGIVIVGTKSSTQEKF